MLVRWKRWDMVLQALAALPVEIRSRVTFEHIGAPAASGADGSHAAELKALTAELGLTDRVSWRGAEPSSARLLGEIDLLVIASEREPFSVAMLEALSAGVPVLAADSGGASDIIRPGENGWLFRSGDAADLARRLEKIEAEKDMRPMSIGPEGLEKFTAAMVARQWEEVYARVF